jgi:hypothetical protein
MRDKKPSGGHWNSGIAVLRNNGLIEIDGSALPGVRAVSGIGFSTPVTGVLLCFVKVADTSGTLSRSDAARCKSMMRKARQTISIVANSNARPGFPRRLFGIARRGAVAAAMITSCISG